MPPDILAGGPAAPAPEGLALALRRAGLPDQAKVAQYCRNRPEYLETMFACFKAGLVPVNTNFRYSTAELTYLWTDADVAAVVFDAEFTATCAELRGQLPAIKAWFRVAGDEGAADCPSWAIAYEEAAALPGPPPTPAGDDPARGPHPRWRRSGDDLVLLYTGG